MTSPEAGLRAGSEPEAAVLAASAPAREPVLPEQSREDTDAGWGE